jgi:hypothetical protein
MRGARLGVTLVLLSVAVASWADAPGAATSCAPVSVQFTSAASRWVYRVEASGGVGCAAARRVVGAVAEQSASPRGWHCRVSTDPRSWALSCVRGREVVRAYGPTRERGSWASVARRLAMPVLEPSVTGGLALDGVIAGRGCGAPGELAEWLLADYSNPEGATLRIAEGRPAPCGNFGVNLQLAVWHVQGRPARLSEFCAPPGCARLTDSYLLTWRERGVSVGLMTEGIDQTTLLAIARSLAPVG